MAARRWLFVTVDPEGWGDGLVAQSCLTRGCIWQATCLPKCCIWDSSAQAPCQVACSLIWGHMTLGLISGLQIPTYTESLARQVSDALSTADCYGAFRNTLLEVFSTIRGHLDCFSCRDICCLVDLPSLISSCSSASGVLWVLEPACTQPPNVSPASNPCGGIRAVFCVDSPVQPLQALNWRGRA